MNTARPGVLSATAPAADARLPLLSLPATVVIALFLAKLASPFNNDPDLWWHLETGEYIVRELTLPYADMFSWTAYGRDWVLHEWLTEVIFHLVVSSAGMAGLNVLVATLYIFTFVILYRLGESILGNSTRALIVTLAYFAPVMAFASPRPQMFTFLLFAVCLKLLFDWKYQGRTRQLAWLPVIMVAWPNLHGAFVAGIALVGLFLAGEWTRRLLFGASGDTRALWKLTLWAGLGVLATLANPRFIDYWVYPFQVVGMAVSQGWIMEWHSPDFHNPYYRYLLAAFLIFFFVLIYSRRKPDLVELVTPVFFIAAGFTAVRHLPLACIVVIPFAALFLRDCPLPRLQLPDGVARWRVLRSASVPLDARVLTVCNLVLLVAVVAMLGAYRLRQPDPVAATMPVKAVDFIVERGLNGRMFNDYAQGGYLIHRLYPAQRVFIDGRADMYGDPFVNEYIAITHARANWKEKFDAHGIDYVLLPRDAPLRQLMLTHPDFRLVYDDGRDSILVREAAQFAHLATVSPGHHAVAPRGGS